MSQTDTKSRLSSLDRFGVIIDDNSHVTESLNGILLYMDKRKYGAVKELISA